MQVWPAFWNFEKESLSAASSRSASAKTTNGAWPPSSSVTFFTVAAACGAASSLPTSTDPVKLICRTSGALVSTSPIVSGSPQTRLTTPGGKPAS